MLAEHDVVGWDGHAWDEAGTDAFGRTGPPRSDDLRHEPKPPTRAAWALPGFDIEA
jgi:hypothetical protein